MEIDLISIMIVFNTANKITGAVILDALFLGELGPIKLDDSKVKLNLRVYSTD